MVPKNNLKLNLTLATELMQCFKLKLPKKSKPFSSSHTCDLVYYQRKANVI